MPRAFLRDPVRRLALCDPGLAWTLPHRSDPRFAAGCGAQRARRHVAHGPEATAWIVRVLPPILGLAWVPFATIWFGVNPSATASSSPLACSGWSSSRRGGDPRRRPRPDQSRRRFRHPLALAAPKPDVAARRDARQAKGTGDARSRWPGSSGAVLAAPVVQRPAPACVARAVEPKSGWDSAPTRSATARRSEWSLPSLRAQRSNPGGRRALSPLDCFVADAPRNDGDCL